ncbi:MAG: TonB family protein [Thiotrichaceae bacterium]
MPIPVATTQTTATKPITVPLPEPIAQANSSSAINGTSDSKAAIAPKNSTLSKNITLKSNDSASAVVKKSQPYTPPNHHASYLHNPKPLYPRISQQLEEQGTVQLLVHVNIHGQVSQVQIKHSCGYPRLDMAALQAVQQWKFIPAKQGDIPIAATTIVPIVFQLSEE